MIIDKGRTFGRKGILMLHTNYPVDNERLLNNIPGGVAIYRFVDPLELLYYNDGICELSGHTRDEYYDIIKDNAIHIVFEEDRTLLLQEIMRASFEERDIDFTYRIYHKHRDFTWVHLSATFIELDTDGYPIYYAIFMDISDERRVQKKLLEIAEHDHLTGVYNRISFERRVEESLSKLEEGDSAFLMLDIDNFKQINDFFGHIKGDEVLCMISHNLTKVFGQHHIVARIGGDEFAVFMMEANAEVSIVQKIEDFRSISNMDYRYQDSNIHLSCSFGIAYAPKDGSTYTTLYVNADKALLFAKNKGKDQYQIYGEYMTPPSSLLLQNMEWLLDEGTNAIYVCNSETYELLYMNKFARQMAGTKGNLYLGKSCYKELMHRDSRCPFCKMEHMKQDIFSERSFQIPNTTTHLLLKGKLINWNGIKAHVEFITYDHEKTGEVKEI